jgi:hypothetical protein
MAHNSGWLPGVAERLGYYVYLLSDPRTERVFDAGQGTGNRCFNHLVEARATLLCDKRDNPKLSVI